MEELDYPAVIERESARFLACLATADPTAPVPSCPEWTAADLLWHLTQVQSFWATIVRDRLQDSDAAEQSRSDTDYAGLLAGFSEATAGLLQALAETADDVGVWTWSDDHTVGFVRRRQAHEALIHRLDAELTVGLVSAMDPAVADDGVDEALRSVLGWIAEWAVFTPDVGFGRIVSSDRGTTWDVTTGRFSGTGPVSGKWFDEPVLQVLQGRNPGSEPTFTVTAPSADLDAWLWQRGGFAAPLIDGDPAAVGRLVSLIQEGIQ